MLRSQFEFIVLGSGCFAPDIGDQSAGVRNPAGYALRLQNEAILFDLGFGNFRRLFQTGVDPRSVSHVFLTHRHPDHVGDIPALLFYLREMKPLAEKIHLFGPRGFKGFMERLSRAHHPWMRPRGFEIHVAELEDGRTVERGGWRVRCREVPHSTESIAFRFESSRADVCYSGDTGFDPGLAAFARNADLFVLECSLADGDRREHHLQVSQAIGLFQASQAKRGLFTHLSAASSRCLSKKIAGLRARPAADLMRVKF